MIYTRKLLSDTNIDRISHIIPKINWIDGRVSGGGHLKKNDQSHPECEYAKEIDGLVYNALDSDQNFLELVVPRITDRIMVTKTFADGYYLPHIDSEYVGHYSTTVFFSDDYDGGELELYVNGKSELIKLPIGHAVTYKTGTPHRVRTVTSGNRYVGVTWSTSRFTDDAHRDLYSDLLRAKRIISNGQRKTPDTLEDWMDDPYSIVDSVLVKIARLYGQ
jgi:PKHD-type hydroxylase